MQAMFVGTRSRKCVSTSFSEEFKVKVGEYQASVLSPLQFIILLEILTQISGRMSMGNTLCR